MKTNTVYLLHFSRPYKHARHYMGSASNLEARLQHHRAGSGARLIQVILEAGLDFVVSRTWPGDKQAERRLKNQKNSPRLCPICNPK
ncbi:MAG TPA: GIY-YIG nuclease family protein [Anaerolineae bacterium]